MDVGTVLRNARERRGLSLDHLAQTTKIRRVILQAIEANRRETLPEAIFLRGFLRTYATEVGLDPEETVRQYLSQFEPAPVVEPVEPGGGEARAQRGVVVHYEIDRRQVEYWAGRIGVVILVIGVGIFFTATRRRAPGPRAEPSAPLVQVSDRAGSPSDNGATAAPLAGSAVATSGSIGATSSGATASVPDVLRFEIEAHGMCWLSATVGGAHVAYRLMRPGDRQTFEVHDDAVLRIGDPAAVSFSINGQDGRMLGQAGEAVTVHITRQNYRAFLQRGP